MMEPGGRRVPLELANCRVHSVMVNAADGTGLLKFILQNAPPRKNSFMAGSQVAIIAARGSM